MGNPGIPGSSVSAGQCVKFVVIIVVFKYKTYSANIYVIFSFLCVQIYI